MEASERTAIRDSFLADKLGGLIQASFQARTFVQPGNPPAGSGTFVWVLERDGVPAHWERPRANGQDPNRGVVANSDSVFKIAAVKCRRIPRKPITINTESPSDSASGVTGDNAASSDRGGSTSDQTTTPT
jgi:hypothetical protein